MDLPKPPDDPELKNIIDKLANFVARNGPEFEQMTKQKQKDNPKFSFLFHGEHFNYYQYKVTTEQAIINQQKQKMAQQQVVQDAMSRPPIPVGTPIPWQQQQQHLPPAQQQLKDQLEVLRKTTQEQVKQSETNLSAQYQSLMHQREVQIEEMVTASEDEEIKKLFAECKIMQNDFDAVLQPIVESCTKDAISSGKNWIFSHSSSDAHSRLVTLYLKSKITAKDASFQQRLHLIYLINDVLHHCMRKSAGELRNMFEKVIIPIFCCAHAAADEEKQGKLVKLLNLWEQNKYFEAGVTNDLKDPVQAMKKYRSLLAERYPNIAAPITTAVNSRYSALQQQHQDFVGHLNSQVQQLEQQLQQPIHPPPNADGAVLPTVVPSTIPQGVLPQVLPQSQPPLNQAGVVQPPMSQSPVMVPSSSTPGPTSQPPPVATVTPGSALPPSFPPPDFSKPPPNFSQPPPGFGPPPATAQFEYGHGQGPPAPIVQEYNHGQGTPSTTTSQPVTGQPPSLPPIPLPDLSRPPPGFPPTMPAVPPAIPPPSIPAPKPVSDADLMPAVPYYELPAGLMAPLVKLEDCSYKPLDPKLIRLPPPMPPNERLLAAVEAFYSPPSHERPRDSEGWEKLGLFEFFKAKEKAAKLKEQEGKKSPSRSRSNSRSRSRSGSNSTSYSRSRSRSRSPSPPRQMFRRRSLSESPPYKRSSKSRSRSRTRSRSRSASPPRQVSSAKDRSPTPPSFGEPFYATNTNTRLGQENKGHMLLKKMGWGGGGLGSSEQGIVDPVEHGEVRDRVDMFKGIGVANNDPFEQFRKNKSQGFIQRMKERDPVK
ncbi:hypothetical protein LSH36_210g04002 [Paralvinella palmiformis]|uniref:Calcium homeostasis endoplasmic reticulum protein n=1 Tax=Paralvinella palmiformis TaxID=53620 RepID=A0AAD9JQZ7_9ANNE|nr:hypothetical protein LSH36_210g04002 [Paralvinella palmiformis]